MRKTITLDGTKIKVWTEKTFSARYGSLWCGRNDYGEPKTSDCAFATETEAMENELMELKKMMR
jgi:hypothetical protein